MWKPIVEDPKLVQALEEKINRITQAIGEVYPTLESEGLLSGRSGICIYYAWLQQYDPEARGYEHVEEILSQNIQRINEGYNITTLGSGIAGMLWMIHHLRSNGFIEFDEDMGDIIEWLSISLRHSSEAAYFDFHDGALGVTKAIMKYTSAEQYYTPLLENLQKHAHGTPDASYWYSYLYMTDEPELAINLGLAHGLPSFMIILAELHQLFPANPEIIRLLDNAIRFMRSVAFEDEKSMGSRYPGTITNGVKNMGGRLAWCYGDMGVAMGFLRTGMITGRDELISEAVQIMQHAAKKRTLEEAKIQDAGFCHGAAGIAHIFNRFYQYTGKEEFRQAALHWLETALGLAKFDDGLAGYKKFIPEEGWFNSIGLLDGIAGIGLVMMSMIRPIEPKWDELFLLSNYDGQGREITNHNLVQTAAS